MLTNEFDFGGIESLNFCVALKGDQRPTFFVPVDGTVRDKLVEMLNHTVAALHAAGEEWEEYDISQEYGNKKRIYADIKRDELEYIESIFNSAHTQVLSKLDKRIEDVDYYFVEAYDKKKRKIVAFKKATRFKATVGAKGRLIRLRDDTLTVVKGTVFQLDLEFDLIATAKHVFILRPHNLEYIGDIVNLVSAAAASKVDKIQKKLNFLDLSGIKAKIGHHRRHARLATAIAQQPNLDKIERDKVAALAAVTGVELTEVGGKLKPSRRSEYRLLQLLDYRLYSVDLSGRPIAFEATARRRVK